ncbi:RCC1 domain-containing protein [Bifidobacterium sp. ESL0820]|uniref:RCC1 domain-containing protein n=1 Tax=Bifidobacterium sp. ESL0820 TaxID=3448586 RepID=UPI004040FA33
MKMVRSRRVTALVSLCCVLVACSMFGLQFGQAAPESNETAVATQGTGTLGTGTNTPGQIPSVSPGPSSSPSGIPTLSNGSRATATGKSAPAASTSPTSPSSLSPGAAGSPEPTSTASSPSNATSHTVTFDYNMQSVAPTTSTVADGAQVARPNPEPTRRGFVLEGWFAGKVAYDFSAPVHTDLTLKAKWARADQTWTMQPQEGPESGGTGVTLTPPPPSGVRFSQVSAGIRFSLALGSDGNVYAWGFNRAGQLGDGTIVNRSTPIRVPRPEEARNDKDFRFVSVNAGQFFSMALDNHGTLWSWGYNYLKTLGNPNVADSGMHNYSEYLVKVMLPEGAPAGFTYKAVNGNYTHTLALGSDGNVYGWGTCSEGQTGSHECDGICDYRPSLIQGFDKNHKIVALQTGLNYSTALDDAGTVWSWGSNLDHQLDPSAGAVVGNSKPIKISGLDKVHVVAIANGFANTLALDDQGRVWTWGMNKAGQIGNGSSPSKTDIFKDPVQVSFPQGTRITAITSGGNFYLSHAMALDSDGNIWAWGDNSYGQMGDGKTSAADSPQTTPERLEDPKLAGRHWISIDAGEEYNLAICDDGLTYSWGRDNMGQLGQGTSGDDAHNRPSAVAFPWPAKLTGLKFDTTDITTGMKAQKNGTWTATTPPHAPGLVDVALAWTLNDQEQTQVHLPFRYLSNGVTVTFQSESDSPAPPSQSLEAGERAVRPSADPTKAGCRFDGWFLGKTAYDFSKPVTSSMTLKAHWSPENQNWSMTPDHGTEMGGTKVTLTPPALRGIRFSQVSAGSHWSLALGSDGKAYAWGKNNSSQLGNANIAKGGTSTMPVRVDMPEKAETDFVFTQVSAGRDYGLALGSDGKAYAWGNNDVGQLGDSTLNAQGRPHPVPGLPAKIQSISAGGGHALALDSQGRVWSWGANQYGQLGLDNAGGDTVSPDGRTSPAMVTGIPATTTAISAGSRYSLAMTVDGQVYAWGTNDSGQLGDPSLPVSADGANPTPSAVQGLTGEMSAISAGDHQALALDSQGRIWTWGQVKGENKKTPALLTLPDGLPTGFAITQISAGTGASSALGSNGQILTWSNAAEGSDPTSLAKPEDTPADFSFTAVSTGDPSSLALGSDGLAYGWGADDAGQLGDDQSGPDLNSKTPQAVVIRSLVKTVTFAGLATEGTPQYQNGTWLAVTPRYRPGQVDTVIQWSLVGVDQKDQTLPYTYDQLAVLPLTGSTGVVLLIIAGLLGMGAAMAARFHRRENKMTA